MLILVTLLVLHFPDRVPGEFRARRCDNDKVHALATALGSNKGEKNVNTFCDRTKSCHLKLFSNLEFIYSKAQQTTMPTLRPVSLISTPAPPSDDPKNGTGWEYTLELSSRERQPLIPKSFSAVNIH